MRSQADLCGVVVRRFMFRAAQSKYQRLLFQQMQSMMHLTAKTPVIQMDEGKESPKSSKSLVNSKIVITSSIRLRLIVSSMLM